METHCSALSLDNQKTETMTMVSGLILRRGSSNHTIHILEFNDDWSIVSYKKPQMRQYNLHLMLVWKMKMEK